MEEPNTTPRQYSYPNADRPLPGSTEEQPEASKPQVHLQDVLAKKPELDPIKVQTIKTFQSDVANAVRQDNVSMIKIALAEKKRQEKQGTFDEALENSKNTNTLIIAGISVVALLAIAGALFFFTSSTSNSTISPITPQYTSYQSRILEAEQKIPFDTDIANLTIIEQFVQKQKTVKTELGDIQQINFVQTVGTTTVELSSAQFLDKLQTRAPDSLLRSLQGDFTFGIYSFTPKDSFLVLKIDPSAYDTAYAGMLEWERYIEDDIGGLLINSIIQPTVSTTTATDTPATNVFRRKPFVDRVIQNKDARVLLNEEGKIQMLYTFFDESTIIFSSSELMLKELIVRLTVGRVVR